jgi:hypothetical protein
MQPTATMSSLISETNSILDSGTPTQAIGGDPEIDYRPAVCRWENDLFKKFPWALRLLGEDEAEALIREIFAAFGGSPPAPALEIVSGFADPQIGGYADVAHNRILIERGFLYAYLVLHEIAHILVPEDHQHGPAFIHVLQALYRTHLDIPDADLRDLMREHGLPDLIPLRN